MAERRMMGSIGEAFTFTVGCARGSCSSLKAIIALIFLFIVRKMGGSVLESPYGEQKLSTSLEGPGGAPAEGNGYTSCEGRAGSASQAKYPEHRVILQAESTTASGKPTKVRDPLLAHLHLSDKEWKEHARRQQEILAQRTADQLNQLEQPAKPPSKATEPHVTVRKRQTASENVGCFSPLEQATTAADDMQQALANGAHIRRSHMEKEKKKAGTLLPSNTVVHGSEDEKEQQEADTLSSSNHPHPARPLSRVALYYDSKGPVKTYPGDGNKDTIAFYVVSIVCIVGIISAAAFCMFLHMLLGRLLRAASFLHADAPPARSPEIECVSVCLAGSVEDLDSAALSHEMELVRLKLTAPQKMSTAQGLS